MEYVGEGGRDGTIKVSRILALTRYFSDVGTPCRTSAWLIGSAF